MQYNSYFYIILLTLIISFIFDLISENLNLKAIKPELPDDFKGIWNDERYDLSQKYLKENTRFGFVSSTFSLIQLLVFWFAGGFGFLDSIAKSFTDNYIYQALIFVAILAAAGGILNSPFSLYSTFVIENKYGFNKTTWKIFLMDTLKGLLLSIVIGAPIFSLVLYLIHSFGANSWVYLWIILSVVSLIMQYIAPTLIMPLFNKFTPLEDGELKDSIFKFADKVKFPLKKIFVMDGSKRSAKSNAFFTGFGKNKRIVLYDTLIEKHTHGELLAILAHEVGHYKKKHILTGMIIGYIHTGILLYLLSIFISNQDLFAAFGLYSQPIHAGMIFFALLYSPIEFILAPAMNALSRKHEYEADEFAVRSTGLKEEFIDSLKKLTENNLSNLFPHPLYVFFNYSHPPVLERIKAIKIIING
ncbi:MAG: M48 family metallopeptidase [Candidatus Kapabacteria bacterium]|nr:M48 family metallopeptidase [Candidatus Kapabacteria bacterium]